MYSYFKEVWGARNRHTVKDLPHPYVFTLLPCKAKDCPHARCQDNGNSEDGNTWFSGGLGMKIKAPSVVIAETLKNADRKGCNLSGEEKLALAKKILLTEEDVEMWLQHLSDVSTRRKEGAKKAAATRRQKNKGHTEGNIKESSGTFYIKGLKNKFSSVLCFWLK